MFFQNQVCASSMNCIRCCVAVSFIHYAGQERDCCYKVGLIKMSKCLCLHYMLDSACCLPRQ